MSNINPELQKYLKFGREEVDILLRESEPFRARIIGFIFGDDPDKANQKESLWGEFRAALITEIQKGTSPLIDSSFSLEKYSQSCKIQCIKAWRGAQGSLSVLSDESWINIQKLDMRKYFDGSLAQSKLAVEILSGQGEEFFEKYLSGGDK
jgi:hypothetical protein